MLLVEPLRGHPVDRGELAVEDDALAAQDEDRLMRSSCASFLPVDCAITRYLSDAGGEVVCQKFRKPCDLF
jgi:hypothetical protein